MSRKLAVVTGASGGIGLELAKLLARHGDDLVLVARSADRLQALAVELAHAHGIAARALPADLADPGAPTVLHDRLREAGVEIHVLVNNAGFGDSGPFAESDLRNALEMLQVNVTALTHLTRLFLPAMVRRRAGRIMNVASVAGFLPGPLAAVYYATKAYVLSFSEALACELEGSGVTVTALCPGPTDTGFQARAGVDHSFLFRRLRVTDAATAARAGYRALLQGRRVAIPGLPNRFLARSVPFVPRGILLPLVRRVNSRA